MKMEPRVQLLLAVCTLKQERTAQALGAGFLLRGKPGRLEVALVHCGDRGRKLSLSVR